MALGSSQAKTRIGRRRLRNPLRLLQAARGYMAHERRAFRQLRHKHDESAALPFFRASSVPMAITDIAGGTIRDVNDRWQELFGLQRADAIGRTARELQLAGPGCLPPSPDREMTCLPVHETVMRHCSGRLLNVVVSGGRIECGGHRYFLTIMQDVTSERSREHELQQQRKQVNYLTRVVLLGELSGALAHELKQPLAAILTNAQVGRRYLAGASCSPALLREILDDIVDAGKLAVTVIQRLRLLFLQGETQQQPVDLNAAARDALALTRTSLAELGVRLSLALDAGAGKVCGDPVQLEQVLVNLIVNACDAMRTSAPGERRLSIATLAGPGERVHLTVSDSGPGIAPELLERVFDPFFTTKPRGLGFGLSVSRAIVAAHGGHISAVNLAGGGTRFRVTLPVAGGDAS